MHLKDTPQPTESESRPAVAVAVAAAVAVAVSMNALWAYRLLPSPLFLAIGLVSKDVLPYAGPTTVTTVRASCHHPLSPVLAYRACRSWESP